MQRVQRLSNPLKERLLILAEILHSMDVKFNLIYFTLPIIQLKIMSENDSGNDDIMGPGVWSDEEEIDLDHDEFEEGTAPDAADNTDPKIERSRENERQRRWLNKLMKSAEKAAQRYQGIQLFMFGLSGYSTLLSKRAFKSVGIGSHMRAIHDGVCSQVKKLYLIHAGKKEALSSMDDVQLGKWKSIVKPGIDMAYEKGIFSSSQVEAFWNMVNDVNLGKNHKDGE